MKTYFFQLTILPEETYSGETYFLNVLSKWSGRTYSDGKPIVNVELLAKGIDYLTVKNFRKAFEEAEAFAENHFAYQAKQEKIAQAKAFLADENAVIDNPVLERYTDVHPFFAEIISNHFTPVS
jgi:hypothetical protein